LRESRTGSDHKRKNDCRNDSRFRYHMLLPTMWNVQVRIEPPVELIRLALWAVA